MKKLQSNKLALLFGVIIIVGSLYITNTTDFQNRIASAINQTSPTTSNNNITVTQSPPEFIVSNSNTENTNPTLPTPSSPINSIIKSKENQLTSDNTTSKTPYTTSPIITPNEDKIQLEVKKTVISFGETKQSILAKLGMPNRVLDTEYNYDLYVYNNDYTNLVMIAISEDQVVGFYTDALDFRFGDITSGSDLTTVNTYLEQDFRLDQVLTYHSNDYTLRILIDKIGTQKVTGIYLLSNKIQFNGFSETVAKNIEIMIFDLTNSVRARHELPTLSWSNDASTSSKKHSMDMANSNFFDHINIRGASPSDRMKVEGVLRSSYGENIIAGYGTAILSNHGWFNSDGHRRNLLSINYTHLGVGFFYDANSVYKNYITQNFHS